MIHEDEGREERRKGKRGSRMQAGKRCSGERERMGVKEEADGQLV